MIANAKLEKNTHEKSEEERERAKNRYKKNPNDGNILLWRLVSMFRNAHIYTKKGTPTEVENNRKQRC